MPVLPPARAAEPLSTSALMRCSAIDRTSTSPNAFTPASRTVARVTVLAVSESLS